MIETGLYIYIYHLHTLDRPRPKVTGNGKIESLSLLGQGCCRIHSAGAARSGARGRDVVRAKLQLDPREERQQPSGLGRPPQTSMEDPGGSTSTGARPESKALAGMPGRQLSAERCVRGRGREAAGGWGAAERSGSQLLLDRGRQAQGVSPTPAWRKLTVQQEAPSVRAQG